MPLSPEINLHQDGGPCSGIENVSIIVHKKRAHRHVNRKRNKFFSYPQEKQVEKPTLRFLFKKGGNKLSNHNSMPEFVDQKEMETLKSQSSDTTVRRSNYPYNNKYTVNFVSEYRISEGLNPNTNIFAQAKWRVYRCQMSSADDSCCCACNSDAMFEVMKSLYDCYKKKNCDHCNCILCGHLPREERKLGEKRKISKTREMAVGAEPVGEKKVKKGKVPSEKMQAAKAEGLLTPLAGKTPEQKEKVIRGLAAKGIPLPEATTASEKKIIDKVRAELGLPPEPKTPSTKMKHAKAQASGIMTPLEGKPAAQKEKLLKAQGEAGKPLPEGRKASEKKIKEKVKAEAVKKKGKVLSEKLQAAKAEGLLTPLEGKTPEQKEKIIRGLASKGIPLPDAKTASEKKIMDKVRAETGLPPEPKTQSMKVKHAKAQADGIMMPLEGKTAAQKEKILKAQAEAGIPLPEGRTASEKQLIEKIKADVTKKGKIPSGKIPSEKLRAAKAEGLLTPLEGKTPQQKEKIIKGLAKMGLPLPEAKTASEKKLIDKVRAVTGLPPEPKTPSMKAKLAKAQTAGIITPLEGKTAAQKEKILKAQAEAGIPLPEGRTTSEKALISKIKGAKPAISAEKLRKAKAAGLLTPLEGKTPEQKEKIIRGLVEKGLPLTEAKTASEKKLIKKVRAEMGLPSEPISPSIKEKFTKAQAAGIMTPLEGKTAAQKEKILKAQAEAGIPLPEGRTASEKQLIEKVRGDVVKKKGKVSTEKLKAAKAESLVTPLEGKTPEQKEKIIRGLAAKGLPLPEAKTASEKKLIDKVRAEKGLPTEPKTSSIKEKYKKVHGAGIVTPLEGKTAAQKEKILKAQAEAGIPLPEGRTPSEKVLIQKVRDEIKKNKSIPEVGKAFAGPGRSALPPDQAQKLDKKTAKGIQEGKGRTSDECICGLLTPESKKLPLKPPSVKGRVPSKVAAEKLKSAKAAGILTPLEGKTPQQKEKIVKSLAQMGLPLPEAKTASEKKIMDKVKAEIGVPPEPKTQSIKIKQAKAQDAGIMTPLEGKTAAQKEKILKGQAEAGIQLPEGRTASEKQLIDKVKADVSKKKGKVPSEKLKVAKADGLLTPLEGKTPEQKEKIIRGLAAKGIPLPEAKTASEKKLINKVRAEIGLPAEPTTPSMKVKYAKAQAAGIMTPLEGKKTTQKEKILKAQAEAGISLPEGRTASEKQLIDKVKADITKKKGKIPSEKLKVAKAEGPLASLEDKTPEQKEKIIRGLAAKGIPLPEAKTASEKKIMNKVRAEMGLPPEPTTSSMKEKHAKAQAAGIMSPLEGKTAAQKEKLIKAQAEAGIPLPEGRTASEKQLIDKIKADISKKKGKVSSEKLKGIKTEGILTPLEGKTLEQKENIIRALAAKGGPLPEAKTASEKKLIDKVRVELRLPPEAKTPSLKQKYEKSQVAGIITPLEGKTAEQKEKIIKAQAEAGIPLPEGRTTSEKALIKKVKDETKKAKSIPEVGKKIPGHARPALPPDQAQKLDKQTAIGIQEAKGRTSDECICGLLTPESKRLPLKPPSVKGRVPSKVDADKLKSAKAAGILTPLEGKTPQQKEKIIKGLAQMGLPLPEAKTASEKKIMDKVKAEIGLPPEPKTQSMKTKQAKAQAAGIITPLEGKTAAQKEKILKAQVEAGIPLPEGRTASEKQLIDKVKADVSKKKGKVPSEKLKVAKADGLISPLEGKTLEQKEKIIRGLAAKGTPLPEAKTASEKKLIDKVKAEMGLAPERKTPSVKEKFEKAQAAGMITPLKGKTPEQKEKILKAQADAGIPLPEGRTASEKAIVKKLKDEIKKAKSITEVGKSFAGPGRPALPPDQAQKLDKQTVKDMQEAKGRTSDECICGLLTPESRRPLKTGKGRVLSKVDKELRTSLKGKTPQEKEQLIKSLAQKGLPLPANATTSEKKIANKLRAEMGLPPEPTTPSIKEKLAKAKIAGTITPLEGKTAVQKEKILKAQAEGGIPLPEGRTASEKQLIEKVKSDVVKQKGKVSSEKLKAAKAEDRLTPLEGKTPEQKEKIIRGLAAKGIPLPEAKTASEKKLIKKVRAEMGLPPEPTTQSMKEKHAKAKTAGILTPLEGKTAAQKEKILKAQAEAGIPLPEGRTASEKKLIDKVKTETKKKGKAPTKIPPEKLQAAKAEGILTSLEGKTPEQKEKIIRGLAAKGLPLPEAKTSSEKKVVDKVRVEMGLPPEPKKAGEKAKYDKALAAGVIVPLEGKTLAEKEKILKTQAEMGITLPEGKTPSEKELIKRIHASPVKKTKSKKVDAVSVKAARDIGVSAVTKTKDGMEEQYEDIVKTTTCERACGCDKKKIRFKHSYVKIRVTSPDISSLCPCPNECLPGVKGGVFTDNEGIKVTVGNAVGVPSFCTEKVNEINYHNLSFINCSNTSNSSKSTTIFTNEIKILPKTYSESNHIEFIYKRNSLYTDSEKSWNTYKELHYNDHSISDFLLNGLDRKSELTDRSSSASRYLVVFSESDTPTFSVSSSSLNGLMTSKSSLMSIFYKTESSLSFSSEICATISVISFDQSSVISTSSNYFGFSQSGSTCDMSAEKSEFFANEIGSAGSESENLKPKSIFDEVKVSTAHFLTRKSIEDFLIFRLSHPNLINTEHKGNAMQNLERDLKPIVLVNYLDNDRDINKILDDVITMEQFQNKSSLFVIIPTSEDNESSLSETVSSTICIRMSENYFFRNIEDKVSLKPRPQGLRIITKGKTNKTNPSKPLNYQTQQRDREIDENELRVERNRASKDYQHRGNKRTFEKETDKQSNLIDETKAITHRIIGTHASQIEAHYGLQNLKAYRPPNTCSRSKIEGKLSVGCEVASEIMNPVTSALGLHQDSYLRVVGITAPRSEALVSPNLTTRISRCGVQSTCGGPNQSPSALNLILSKQCSCHSMTSYPPTGESCQSKKNYTKNLNNVSTSCRGLRAPSIISERQASCCGLPPKEKCKIARKPKVKCMCHGKGKKVEPLDGCNCKEIKPETCKPAPCTTPAPFVLYEPQMPCSAHPPTEKSKNARKEKVKCTSKGKKGGLVDGSDCKKTKPETCTPAPCAAPAPCTAATPCIAPVPTNAGPCAAKVSFAPLPNDENAPCSTHVPNFVPTPCTVPVPCSLPTPCSAPTSCFVPPPCFILPPDFIPDNAHPPEKFVKDVGCQFCNKKEKYRDRSCTCRTKSGKNNVICECPPPEPEEHIFQEIDEGEVRRLKSDMTQTTSGFKLKIKEKAPPVPEVIDVDQEISFEDALKYLDLYDAYNKNLKKSKKYKNTDCECTAPAPKNNCICPKQEKPEEKFIKGFKVTMDGKGSASTGLAGVCCFDRCLKKNK